MAIARALANAPALLLADEPTGNLDHRTSDEVFDLLTRLVKAVGLAAMIATHNLELARRMGRILTITDGELSEGGVSCRTLTSYPLQSSVQLFVKLEGPLGRCKRLRRPRI